MLKQMMAEIIFRNPGDINPAIADLIGFDFEVRILDDWIDDDGPAVWIRPQRSAGSTSPHSSIQ